MSLFRIAVVAVTIWLFAASGATAVPVQSPEGPFLGSAGAPSTRQSFVLALTGDTLPHPRVSASAARHSDDGGYDFSPMFDGISIVVESADLALCHLEVPLDPESREISGFPVFSAPAELATALAGAGFDGCSTASNHSLDRGLHGALETLRVLDDAGLGHTGTAAGPEDAQGRLYDLGGLVVGHSSYSYGFQRHRVPADQEWLANQIDADRIIADATELRHRGAGFVAVSLHWGVEFSGTPSAGQRSLAEQLLADPAVDLVVGHHPHVLQPIALSSGKPVLYSLGNLLSNQTAPCCPPESEEGAILLIRVDSVDGGWEVGEMKHVPFWVDRHGGHIIEPALGDSAAESRHSRRLRQAATRVQRALGSESEGLSVPDAYRWILKGAPSRWQTTSVAPRSPGLDLRVELR
jgi:poly-gamma-glutamate synthesis protein (capsule biosynthesis protein)